MRSAASGLILHVNCRRSGSRGGSADQRRGEARLLLGDAIAAVSEREDHKELQPRASYSSSATAYVHIHIIRIQRRSALRVPRMSQR